MCKDTCSIRISMEEENKDVEEEINSAKADKTKSATPTNGKRTDAVPGSLAQGEVITPDQAIAETQLSAGTTESPTTTKRSVERRSVKQAVS